MNASLKTDKADLTQIRRLENELRQLRKKEKKHALVEKTLAISQASINELANLLPNSVFELDMKGNVVFANTAGLNVFGLTQKDLKKGFTAFDVIAPESHEDVRKNMQKVLKGGQEHMPHQYLGLKKDGTKFPVLLQSSSVIKNGKAVGIRGVILDITKMQEAHDLISKAKSELEHTVEMRDIELKISVEKLHRILEQIISAFASTIEKRDPYTAGHQQRTATLAQAIAHKMGLSVETIKTIYMASLIHDIGKIYVPAEILSKPSKLNDLEMNIVKLHPEIGHEILSSIEFPWPITRIILEHHERIDGSGYPRGIKGRDMLLESKILSVADVVEAMASHRPYRPSLGMKSALEEICKNKGRFYDRDVVEACVKVLTEV